MVNLFLWQERNCMWSCQILLTQEIPSSNSCLSRKHVNWYCQKKEHSKVQQIRSSKSTHIMWQLNTWTRRANLESLFFRKKINQRIGIKRRVDEGMKNWCMNYEETVPHGHTFSYARIHTSIMLQYDLIPDLLIIKINKHGWFAWYSFRCSVLQGEYN